MSPAAEVAVMYDIDSADASHHVEVRPISAPDRGVPQSYARCTCGWGQVDIFAEQSRLAALAHVRRLDPK